MTQKKTAYLTIDDTPSKDFLNKVDYLLNKKIPAVFFCISQLLEQFPEETIYAIQKGFAIANHSYNHPHFSNISLEQAHFEIGKTDEIIEKRFNKSEIKKKKYLFLANKTLTVRALSSFF